jgi:hypothetical protein
LQPVEDFSDRDSLPTEIENLKSKLKSVQQRRSIFRRIQICLGIGSDDTNRIKRQLEKKQKRLYFFHDRTSPPKCLECSSPKIKLLSIPSFIKIEGKRKISSKHPSCGGHLMVEDSGARFTAVITGEHVYSLEGEVLSKPNSPEDKSFTTPGKD